MELDEIDTKKLFDIDEEVYYCETPQLKHKEYCSLFEYAITKSIITGVIIEHINDNLEISYDIILKNIKIDDEGYLEWPKYIMSSNFVSENFLFKTLDEAIKFAINFRDKMMIN